MLKVREIQIKNFRAFSGATTTIDLPRGENLIVLGENGSGKSSLFNAIKNFFESVPKSLSITEHPYKNFLAEVTADVFVKLKFLPLTAQPSATPTAAPAKPLKLDYEWSNHTNDSDYLARQGLDVTKGFIDYKDLLQTYFLQQKADSVNVFDFLLENVLEDVKVLNGSQTFGENWKMITNLQKSIVETQKSFDRIKDKRIKAARALKMRLKRDEAAIQAQLDLMNVHVNAILPPLTIHTNNILRAFNMNISIEMDYALARYEVAERNKRAAIKAKEIVLHVNFYDQRRPKHHHFLNEARLSAIAVSLYFASFLVNPQAGIKILVLDDLLIGLDMENRKPVLDILRDHFPDFQIFIFTFDKLWFDNVRLMFPDYKKLELVRFQSGTYETISVRKAKDFLEKAEEFYAQHEMEAAANAIRKYYEQTIKDFCQRKRLTVNFQFQNDINKIPASAFWTAIISASHRITLDPTLKREIENCQTNVNNPLSHANTNSVHSAEVRRAIDKVKELNAALEAIR